jgi:arabinose-5-phosphate isomerase|tara:strand:+ start:1133 stop:2098 length:966 start_codon:yes stop_codon:yes gene_type:complete
MSKEKQIIDIAKQVIDDEVEALKGLKNYIDKNFEEIIDVIFECKGRIIFTGIGKSGHISKKISATLSSTGTSSFFMHSTEAFHGDLGMIQSDDIVVAISYSGETEDLLKTIPIIKKLGCSVIGVSGNDESTLSKISDYHQLIKVEKEACPLDLAPTSSATATLVWGDALAISLMNKKDFKPEDFAQSHPGGTLGKRLLLSAGDVMVSGDDIPIINHNELSKDVIKIISEKGIGVTFVKENKEVVGIITDGDIRRAIDKSNYFFDMTAQDFMSQNYISVTPDDLASKCLNIMAEKKIGCLAVMHDDDLVGIINQKDLVKLGI